MLVRLCFELILLLYGKVNGSQICSGCCVLVSILTVVTLGGSWQLLLNLSQFEHLEYCLVLIQQLSIVEELILYVVSIGLDDVLQVLPNALCLLNTELLCIQLKLSWLLLLAISHILLQPLLLFLLILLLLFFLISHLNVLCQYGFLQPFLLYLHHFLLLLLLDLLLHDLIQIGFLQLSLLLGQCQ